MTTEILAAAAELMMREPVYVAVCHPGTLGLLDAQLALLRAGAIPPLRGELAGLEFDMAAEVVRIEASLGRVDGITLHIDDREPYRIEGAIERKPPPTGWKALQSKRERRRMARR